MIHNWLPTNNLYTLQHIGTGKLCPYCQSCDKDQDHYLACTHSTITNNWTTAAKNITAKIHKCYKEIDRQLLNLLSQSIAYWRRLPTPPIPADLHPKLHQLFRQQSLIGWSQVLNGRHSWSWRHALNMHPQQADQWMTYSIRTISSECY
jgi:hypothetical protein